jgi:ABC-type uncharacterized transport system permease subunit
MKRYLSVTKGMIAYSLRQQLAYLTSSWFGLFSSVGFCVTYLVSFGLIADRLGSIAGFTKDQIYLSLFVGEMSFLLIVARLYDPANYLNNLVKDGGLDFLLVRPFSVKLSASIMGSDILDAVQTAVVAGVVIGLQINWHNLVFTPASVALAFVVLVCGYYVCRTLFFLLVYPAFIYGDASESIGFAWTMFYQFYTPYEALPRFMKVAVYGLVPSMLMTGGVVNVALGRPGHISIVLYSLLSAALSIFCYKVLWRRALKRYTSASS